MSAVCCRPDDV